MRVTVCELPHETTVLASAWAALCEHARAQVSELVLLPEFAMVEPVWESERFTADRWRAIEGRLPVPRSSGRLYLLRSGCKPAADDQRYP